jgi:S-adenosylmethionine-diacylgycerolhomoserine-N-methlytransferase
MTAAVSTTGQAYRYRRYMRDLTRQHTLLGRETLLGGLIPPDGGSVLEIGCGAGDTLIRAAERYSDTRFYGIDASTASLAAAAGRIAAAGLAHRVRLAQADAASFDAAALFGLSVADRVILSYALSALPNWPSVIERAADILSPQGSLHVVDFGAGEGLPGPIRAAFHGWLRGSAIESAPALDVVLAQAAARRGWDAFVTPLYRGYAVYGVLTRR